MAKVSNADLLLASCISFVIVDLLFTWDRLGTCSRPLNLWLLGSYVLFALSRIAYVAGGMMATERGADHRSFLVCARHTDRAPRALFWVNWLLLVPAFGLWTGLGSSWFHDVTAQSPDCLPGTDMMFIRAWQLLSWIWLAMHAWLAGWAILWERRLRLSERELGHVEDEDSVSRWGHVSRLSATDGPLAKQSVDGLHFTTIAALPGVGVVGALGCDDCCGEDCPICLCEFQEGDASRSLGACGHTFHRSCIDLWLVRCANCPLCKTQVSTPSQQKVWFV